MVFSGITFGPLHESAKANITETAMYLTIFILPQLSTEISLENPE